MGAVLVNVLTGTRSASLSEEARHGSRHRFHRWALASPFVVFVVLLPFGWNPIYPGIGAMLVGAILTIWCHRRRAVRVEAHGEEGDDSADVRMNEP